MMAEIELDPPRRSVEWQVAYGSNVVSRHRQVQYALVGISNQNGTDDKDLVIQCSQSVGHMSLLHRLLKQRV